MLHRWQAVYKEVAALLAGEEVEGAVEDVTADKEAAEDGDMMDGDMADGDTMEGDTMEGDMADGDVMEGGGMGEEKDEKEA